MTFRSWKPQVMVNGQWSGNRLVFGTRQEALANARELEGRWNLVERVRALMVRDPVNAAWREDRLVWPLAGSEEGEQ